MAQNSETTTTTEKDEKVAPTRRPLVAPGKPMSFEEALKRSSAENKELLQLLSK